MPHDKFGQELKAGDTVLVEMTVRQVYPDADMCNVQLVREVEGEQSLSLMCQAKQVALLAPAHLRATSSLASPPACDVIT